MYYTYMLRCEDDSIYTGITNNIHRRMEEHFNKDKKGAKYTKSHTARSLECVWQTEDRVLASKLEYYIKKLTKNQKEKIIQRHILDEEILGKIDCSKYTFLNKYCGYNYI